MTEPPFERDEDFNEQDIEILVDVLRQCFDADKARYHLPSHQNAIFIEISGLQELSQDEIADISEPVVTEFDPEFDEIMILPLTN